MEAHTVKSLSIASSFTVFLTTVFLSPVILKH